MQSSWSSQHAKSVKRGRERERDTEGKVIERIDQGYIRLTQAGLHGSNSWQGWSRACKTGICFCGICYCEGFITSPLTNQASLKSKYCDLSIYLLR